MFFLVVSYNETGYNIVIVNYIISLSSPRDKGLQTNEGKKENK